MEKYSPLDIINTILLEGMKVVGELFRKRADAIAICAAKCGNDEGGGGAS